MAAIDQEKWSKAIELTSWKVSGRGIALSFDRGEASTFFTVSGSTAAGRLRQWMGNIT